MGPLITMSLDKLVTSPLPTCGWMDGERNNSSCLSWPPLSGSGYDRVIVLLGVFVAQHPRSHAYARVLKKNAIICLRASFPSTCHEVQTPCHGLQDPPTLSCISSSSLNLFSSGSQNQIVPNPDTHHRLPTQGPGYQALWTSLVLLSKVLAPYPYPHALSFLLFGLQDSLNPTSSSCPCPPPGYLNR